MAISMPQHDEPRAPVTEAEVLAHLSRSRKPQSLREIAAALGLRHSGRRALVKLARKMKKRGEIHEYPNGRIALPPKKQGAQYAEPPHKGVPHGHGSDQPGESRVAVRPEANQLTGRLVAHRDGYGFVVPDTPRKDLDGDLFIGRDAMGDAMHGDHVLASIERRSRFGDGAGRAEGRILRVIGRAHTTVVGLFKYGPRGNTVAPYESRLVLEIIIPPGEELTLELQGKLGLHQPKRGVRLPELDGAVVNVELTRFPRSGVAPAGRVIEILGRPGDFGVDVEILIRKHHLPHDFSSDVLAEAASVARPVGDAERAGRRDFRDLPIVTIDGETARDFDDAVHVRRLTGGNWQLHVHIADVSHYVRRGSALDREARLRGTSVYFPNRAVPMLPEELSNGICSLNPREDRLVMSAIMEIDENGEIVSSEFARGVIRSAERMTYTAVNAVLQHDAAATAQYAPLAENFRMMRDLAMILNARRARLGSIDFDLPEPVIEFDPAGQMTGIVRSERNIAHRLIEEFMLAANQAVARYLESRGIGSLHRVHEKPDPKKILEFEALAQTFGYSLGIENLSERRLEVKHGNSRPQRFDRGARHGRRGGGREKPMTVSLPGTLDIAIRPSHYQRLAEKIAGKPEERIVAYLMLRSLKQARYAADPLGHFALAFDQYTHFTSPIRRYPDLIVHRVLKWALDHAGEKPAAHDGACKEKSTFGPYRRGELDAISVETSETERRAETAERELMSWKTADFMEQRLGEEYDALIISVQKFGFFVELTEIFVEGIVPIDRIEGLTGEHAFYREQDHAIVSGSGHGSGTQGASRDKSQKKKSHTQTEKGTPQHSHGPEQGRRMWKLGDRIRVRAERIDPIRRRVEFSPI
ncbi:MAG TPA: VacB/RNase II family 3'-5' exoribonuclease [Candidatus Acidoferrales bacterium]|nr:VacB/RNase II family 3'-5' exoribonuclease [Candidatus Acidoferrales bacterium]